MANQSAPVRAADSGVGKPTAGARWGILAVLLSCDFMVTLDFFIVNVALPSVQRDLGAGPASVQFVVAGYGLAYAAGLITWGRLGDIHGRRRLFVLGLALFTAASVACGLAPSAELLVVARVAQGLTAGLMAPQVLAILGTTYTGADRVRAFTVAGLSKGLAGVFGQLIGGALIQSDVGGLGWRLCFLINLPIGLAALVFARRVIPESRAGGSTRLDVRGAVLVTLGLVALILPLIEGREAGWPAWSWLCLTASAVLLAAFVAHQRALTARAAAPLVNTDLFRDRTFTVGVAATTLYYASMGAFLLVLALYLQDGLGLSALGSGLVYTALGAGFFLVTLCGPAIVRRLGPRVIGVGALVLAAGWVGLGATAAATDAAAWHLPALLVCGIGMGLVLTQLTAVTIAAVPVAHAGSASGVLNTALQIGSALGVAVVGIVYYGVLGADPDAYSRALASSLIGLVALGIAIAALVRLIPSAQPVPATRTEQ
ncbi:MFS transporter [Actinokineospora sp.]|uniref:MFS transporter n=1 Tax=Actinokineospora sp. TaxID=1872133 RepID=UPI0040380DC7